MSILLPFLSARCFLLLFLQNGISLAFRYVICTQAHSYTCNHTRFCVYYEKRVLLRTLYFFSNGTVRQDDVKEHFVYVLVFAYEDWGLYEQIVYLYNICNQWRYCLLLSSIRLFYQYASGPRYSRLTVYICSGGLLVPYASPVHTN